MITSDPITFLSLRDALVRRCPAFGHTVEDWSPRRWAIAVLGEAGEVANAVKKLIRGDGSRADVADEIADLVIYLELLAARLAFSPSEDSSLTIEGLQLFAARSNGYPDETEMGTLHLGTRVGLLCLAIEELPEHPSSDDRMAVARPFLGALHTAIALASSLGIDADQAIVAKFNAVSRRIGSEVLL